MCRTTLISTKPQLALAMIERAIKAEVPFAWVAADSIYGVGEIELALRRADTGYVLGVTGRHRFWSWDQNLDVAGTAEEIAKDLSKTDWIRLSAGSGTKGPRLFVVAHPPSISRRRNSTQAATWLSFTKPPFQPRGLSRQLMSPLS